MKKTWMTVKIIAMKIQQDQCVFCQFKGWFSRHISHQSKNLSKVVDVFRLRFQVKSLPSSKMLIGCKMCRMWRMIGLSLVVDIDTLLVCYLTATVKTYSKYCIENPWHYCSLNMNVCGWSNKYCLNQHRVKEKVNINSVLTVLTMY